MDSLPSLAFWFHTLATLALQVTVALAAAMGLHLFVKSARGRQVLWPASFLGLALILVGFVTGIDREVAEWVATVGGADRPHFVMPANMEPSGLATLPREGASTEDQPRPVFCCIRCTARAA